MIYDWTRQEEINRDRWAWEWRGKTGEEKA